MLDEYAISCFCRKLGSGEDVFMKRVTQDPLPAVKSMLRSCSNDEVSFFFIGHANGKAICVYPTSGDAFAARNAVVLLEGHDLSVQASVIGLVRLHNLHLADQTSAAVNAFIENCTAGFHFGDGFGEET